MIRFTRLRFYMDLQSFLLPAPVKEYIPSVLTQLKGQ